MLGSFWRFQGYNATSDTLQLISAYYRRWKFGTDGALAYDGTEQNWVHGTLATVTYAESAAALHDNTSDLYLGFEGIFTTKSAVAMTTGGDVTLWYQQNATANSTVDLDSGTPVIGDGRGYVLGVINFADADDDDQLAVPISY